MKKILLAFFVCIVSIITLNAEEKGFDVSFLIYDCTNIPLSSDAIIDPGEYKVNPGHVILNIYDSKNEIIKTWEINNEQIVPSINLKQGSYKYQIVVRGLAKYKDFEIDKYGNVIIGNGINVYYYNKMTTIPVGYRVGILYHLPVEPPIPLDPINGNNGSSGVTNNENTNIETNSGDTSSQINNIVGEPPKYTIDMPSSNDTYGLEFEIFYNPASVPLLFINKNDNNKNIEGIQLEIVNSNNEILAKWTSRADKNANSFVYLPDGEYTFRAVNNISGYEKPQDVKFTIGSAKVEELLTKFLRNVVLTIDGKKVNEFKPLADKPDTFELVNLTSDKNTINMIYKVKSSTKPIAKNPKTGDVLYAIPIGILLLISCIMLFVSKKKIKSI